MKETFIEFLKKHNAYENFINNLLAEESWELDELYETLPARKWLNCAFEWFDTSEGYNYWDALDSLWWDIVYDAMI